MNAETASLSLLGDRKENQDRVAALSTDGALLLVAVDGMGGHSQGAAAAQVAVDAVRNYFAAAKKPLLDPQGFLTMALSAAHDEIVTLGTGLPLDQRPRATCAVCLVQDEVSYWAHVGDSRVYQLRSGIVVARTRDHSHVELLLREGVIDEEQINSHPMRNLVECCLGGDSPLPDVSVTAGHRLLPGDALVVCTDGFWSGVDDELIAATATDATKSMTAVLEELGNMAIRTNAPHSDNTSASAMRWPASA